MLEIIFKNWFKLKIEIESGKGKPEEPQSAPEQQS